MGWKLMNMVFNYNNCKLNINMSYLAKFVQFMRIDCDGNILYDGEIDKYSPIEIKPKRSIYLYLYLMVDGDYLFFDRYFLQKKILAVESRMIEEYYNKFFREVEECINGWCGIIKKYG